MESIRGFFFIFAGAIIGAPSAFAAPIITFQSPSTSTPFQTAADTFTVLFTVTPASGPLKFYYRVGNSSGCSTNPSNGWTQVSTGTCANVNAALTSCTFTLTTPSGSTADEYLCAVAGSGGNKSALLSAKIPVWKEGKVIAQWRPDENGTGGDFDEPCGGSAHCGQVHRCTIDNSGSIYLTGVHRAGAGTTSGDGFAKKFNSNFSALSWTLDASNLWSSPGKEFAQGLAVDAAGNFYIAGNDDDTLPGSSATLHIKKFDSTGPVNYPTGIWHFSRLPTQNGIVGGYGRLRWLALGTNDEFLYAAGTTTTYNSTGSAPGENVVLYRLDATTGELLANYVEGENCDATGVFNGNEEGRVVIVKKHGSDPTLDHVWTISESQCSGSGGWGVWIRRYNYDLSSYIEYKEAFPNIDFGAHGAAMDPNGDIYVGGYTTTTLRGTQPQYAWARKFTLDTTSPECVVTGCIKEVNTGGWARTAGAPYGILFDGVDAPLTPNDTPGTTGWYFALDNARNRAVYGYGAVDMHFVQFSYDGNTLDTSNWAFNPGFEASLSLDAIFGGCSDPRNGDPVFTGYYSPNGKQFRYAVRLKSGP